MTAFSCKRVKVTAGYRRIIWADSILLPNLAVFHIRRISHDYIKSARVHDAVEFDEPVEGFMRGLPFFESGVRLEILLIVLPGKESIELGAQRFENAFERILSRSELGGGLADVVLKILELAEGDGRRLRRLP